jgi:hypothetical protein
MRVCRRFVASLLWCAVALAVASVATVAFGQASYTAQVRGVVKDQSGAMITDATIAITNDATGISTTAHSDEHGLYILTGLRPAVYTIRADRPGFRPAEQKNVVLQVDQQTSIDFELHPLGVSTTVEVTEAAPLLDTENATIGTDVANEYVRDIPLYGRNPFGLVFLAGGVTETTGSDLSYPAGTNFVSNGQRKRHGPDYPRWQSYQCAGAGRRRQLQRLLPAVSRDRAGIQSPEQQLLRGVREQRRHHCEHGAQTGGNAFHGSGWWYLQRSATDARDFFNSGDKPDHVRDQYGFSLGGPIFKNKTFFFVDFEKVRQQDPINLEGRVPTDAERTGDFSHSLANMPDPANPDTAQAGIYDPCAGNPQGPTTPCAHVLFPGNVIPPDKIDPIGQAILNLYPHENIPDAVYPDPNWRQVIVSTDPGWQFDVKLDHQFTANHRIGGRYSRHHDQYTAPTFIGSDQGDGYIGTTTVQNGSGEYNWSVTPTALFTGRFSVDRVNAPVQANKYPTLSDVGLSPDLAANGLTRIPTIGVDDPFLSIFTQCCVDTNFAHTLFSYSAGLQWVKGGHSIKFGGEQRVFLNNFWQPDNPTGIFNFSRDVTTAQPNSGLGDDDHRQGNPFATILTGYPHDASLHLVPAVADKSMETGFYVQDDWKVTPRLTVNLGLRTNGALPTQSVTTGFSSTTSLETQESVFLWIAMAPDCFLNLDRLGESGASRRFQLRATATHRWTETIGLRV